MNKNKRKKYSGRHEQDKPFLYHLPCLKFIFFDIDIVFTFDSSSSSVEALVQALLLLHPNLLISKDIQLYNKFMNNNILLL